MSIRAAENFRVLFALAGLTAVSCSGAATNPGSEGEPGTGGETSQEGGRGGTRAGRGGSGPGSGGEAGASTPTTGGAPGGTPGGGEGGSAMGGQSEPDDAGPPDDAMTPPPPPDDAGPPPLPGGHFRHPGVLVNKAQLDFIRDKVKAGAQPWKTAFDKALATDGSLSRNPSPRPVVECGPYSSPDIGCSQEINDASAAYVLAIAWNVTGNEAYAKKSIEVMNAWARTLKSHANHNAPLQSGWAGSIWPVAGEIIRYTYNGWAPADVAAFSSMLKDVYLPTVLKGSGGNGNWELVMIEAAVQAAVFLDDRATFDQAIAMWEKRVPAYFYVKTDGDHPAPPPTGGKDTPEAIKAFWFNIGMYVDGVAQETCRDFGHTEYGLASTIAVAETAFQQGLDLYKEHSTRIRAAMELHAQYTLNPAPSWMCGGNPNTRLMPTWEIGYNHFHDRLGIELPFSLKIIQGRVRGVEGSNKHMVWETLSHAGVGWAGLK